MSSPQRHAIIEDAIIASDFHIHDDSHLKQVSTFCDLVDSEKPSLLILNGDIGDPWEEPWEAILKTSSWKRLSHTCELRDQMQLETIWINRNHDFNAKWRYLPHVHLRGRYYFETTYQVKTPEFHLTKSFRIMCLHGWEFDLSWGGLGFLPGVSELAFWMSTHFPQFMIPTYHLLFGRRTPGMLKKKIIPESRKTVDDWDLHVGVIHLRARGWARGHNVAVIIGHTHCPTPFDGLIVDSGDMIDSFSYARLKDGNLELKYLYEDSISTSGNHIDKSELG